MPMLAEELLSLIQSETWRRDAACAVPDIDPDIFFPDPEFHPKDERQAMAAEARTICASCPVKSDCLEWALNNLPLTVQGIYAGTSYGQRKRMVRSRTERVDA